MGTISQKLTYLNNTKQLLKENINNLGGNLTNEPFRQYASVLEGIYERIPKISGIGASLSLSPSMVGKIKLNEIQGDTLQNGTPTPSSPVPIQSVTGLQNVEVCDKNLLDTSSFYKGYVNSSGVVTSDSVQALFDYVKVVPSGTYTISSQGTIASLNIVQYDANKNFISRTIQSDNPKTFTLGNTTYYIRIWTKVNDSTPMTQEIVNGLKLQFEKGDTATTYEPYKGNTYEVNLGKNLFDKDNANIINAFVNGNNGLLNTPTNNQKSVAISVQPNTQYTISGVERSSSNYGLYDDTTLTIGTSVATVKGLVNNGKLTFTTGASTKWFVFLIGAGTETYGYNNVQLEKGSTATSYSPYFTPIELNKIGTYEDSIKKSTGKNLFNLNTSDSNKGIDYSFNGSALSLNGTTTGEGNIYNNNTNKILLKSGTYAIKTYTNGTFTRNNKDVAIYIRKKSNSSALITLYSTANYIIDSTFTLTEDTEVYVQMYTNGSGFVFNNFNIYIMLNEGTALPYEPYGKVWYITKNIGKYVFTGNETWETSTYGTNSWTMTNVISTNYDTSKVLIISNIFKGVSNDDRATSGNNKIYFGGLDNVVYIRDTSLTTLTEVRNTTNGNYAYYVRKTPTYTKITNTELINQLESLNNAKSKDGTTNINVTSEDLSMILNVSVIKGE